MSGRLLNAWQFNAGLRLASLILGMAVVAPSFLLPGFRRRIFRSDARIEDIGLLALVVVVVAICCSNALG
ncbi:hypothetical protein [Marilutibacter aestuarii]|uniref:Uncharacterized protein n=1 Tax=Marilutibacter aestuarii TaxID=1706195 RepID=A0A508AIW2_9GAMM|nr:hypothetical protein [Lysobacter aestuarii]TQD49749.1 hypothetical protein FKV25_04005 [Lysobacter aestuarii]